MNINKLHWVLGCLYAMTKHTRWGSEEWDRNTMAMARLQHERPIEDFMCLVIDTHKRRDDSPEWRRTIDFYEEVLWCLR